MHDRGGGCSSTCAAGRAQGEAVHHTPTRVPGRSHPEATLSLCAPLPPLPRVHACPAAGPWYLPPPPWRKQPPPSTRKSLNL
eukprot:gene20664-biopygen8584